MYMYVVILYIVHTLGIYTCSSYMILVDVACSIRDSQWIFLHRAQLLFFGPVTIKSHSAWLIFPPNDYR